MKTETQTEIYPIFHTFKVCPQRAKANAKAKKIKEQSEEIKEQMAKHQRKFSLSLGLNTALPIANWQQN